MDDTLLIPIVFVVFGVLAPFGLWLLWSIGMAHACKGDDEVDNGER